MDTLSFYCRRVTGPLVDEEIARLKKVDSNRNGRLQKFPVSLPRQYRFKTFQVKLTIEETLGEFETFMYVNLVPYKILRKPNNTVSLTVQEMGVCLQQVCAELGKIGIEFRIDEAYLCGVEVTTTVAITSSVHVLVDLISAVGSFGPWKASMRLDFGFYLFGCGTKLMVHDKVSAEIAKRRSVDVDPGTHLARLELRISGARNIAAYVYGREWMIHTYTGYTGDMPRPEELSERRISLAEMLNMYDEFENARDYYFHWLMHQIKQLADLSDGRIFAENQDIEFQNAVLWVLNSARCRNQKVGETLLQLGLLAIQKAKLGHQAKAILFPGGPEARSRRNARSTFARRFRALRTLIARMPKEPIASIPDEVILQLRKPNGLSRLELVKLDKPVELNLGVCDETEGMDCVPEVIMHG